jgi:hypothetical protein
MDLADKIRFIQIYKKDYDDGSYLSIAKQEKICYKLKSEPIIKHL